MSSQVDETPRELPSFAFPKSRGDIARENLAKARVAREANIENRKQARDAGKNPPEEVKTLERAVEVLREELIPMAPTVAKIFKAQLTTGSQAQRAAAAREWRDMVMGKPKQQSDEDERPTTIIIESEVFGAIRDAKQEHGR